MNEVEGNPVCGSGDYKKKKKANGMENSSMLRAKRFLTFEF